MAFPSSPTIGQQYEKWEWNGTGWIQSAVSGGSLTWQKIQFVHTLDTTPFSADWTGITYV